MKLLIKANTSFEPIDVSNYAILELTDTLIELLETSKLHFDTLKDDLSPYSNLHCVTFWFNDVLFISGNELDDTLETQLEDKLTDANCVVITDDLEVVRVRLDHCKLQISEGGFKFVAYEKHSMIELWTETIEWMQLNNFKNIFNNE